MARSDFIKGEWIGREYGSLRVIGEPFTVKGALRHVRCVCKCGKEVLRNVQSLARARGGSACDECRAVGKGQARTQEVRRSALIADLTDTERAQADRIFNERRVPSYVNYLEAVQCVLADRRAEEKEMVCHGGDVWTL